MRAFASITFVAGIWIAAAGTGYSGRATSGFHPGDADDGIARILADHGSAAAGEALSPVPTRNAPGAAHPPAANLTNVVQRYCQVCHNDALLTGNLSLAGFDIDNLAARAETVEKMILKLRAGMMPPPGMPRPVGDTLELLVTTLEDRMDAAFAADPNPGTRSFQRLNRAEYERSVKDLLDLDIDAGEYLPLDTKSANFDNIADAQMLSPTLAGSLPERERATSRGWRWATRPPPRARPSTRSPAGASQTERVEGAPYGTRGGLSVEHNFPADGEYVFRVSFHHETTGTLVGNGRNALHTDEFAEQLEISIDGERVAVLELDRWMHVSDPNGVEMRTEPVFVRCRQPPGDRRLPQARGRPRTGPDLPSTTGRSRAPPSPAPTACWALPHLRDLVIGGPFNPTGVSETASRRAIFTCRPTDPSEETACATEIISRLGRKAFRRPLVDDDMTALMAFFRTGADEGGFEAGIGTALEAILASPHFVFRFEEPPSSTRADGGYRIGDIDLAARLSFFLWGTSPDEELMQEAVEGRLSDPAVLDAQVTRMLADPRAEALGTRFAAQWLRLQDLEKINPNVRLQPDFYQQLRESMYRETELFFYNLVREDRSVFDLYSADYTFVDERLARHYGIPDVAGDHFRRVEYPDDKPAWAVRPRQHSDAHLARRTHLSGPARQVGHGGAARHSAATAAAGRARP